MKILLTLLLVLLSGCTEPEQPVKEEPKQEERKTRPMPPYRPKRMVATKPIIVAVIDTGFGYKGLGTKAKLCKQGHKNFTSDLDMAPNLNTEDPVPMDYHGHGTNIVGIIDRYANWSTYEYCIVIVKYYSPGFGDDNLKNTVKAIKYATAIGADFINYSGGGKDRSQDEVDAIQSFLNNGGTVVAAAGNEGADLKLTPFYPALADDRIIVVGNLGFDGNKAPSSNYGEKVDIWERGTSIEGFGLIMTGTSQAAAVVTGKMIKQKIENRK